MSDAKLGAASGVLGQDELATIVTNTVLRSSKLPADEHPALRAVIESAGEKELRALVLIWMKKKAAAATHVKDVIETFAQVHGGGTTRVADLEKRMTDAASRMQ